LDFLDKRFAEEQKSKPEKERAKEGLIEKLENVIAKRFKRVSYTEAIEILLNSKENKKGNSFILLKNGEPIYSLSTRDS
jgi:asparaginyl-tRNA synthetase